MKKIIRIGIVGSGYIARGLVLALEGHSDLAVSKVLTRSNTKMRTDFPAPERLTNSVAELIDQSDLIVECSGDVVYATDVIDRALAASLPVVTMDSELQVTTGSYFAKRGFITEAEGDQPGCIAALHEEAIQMGFKPLVYGNIKGFLNLNPTKDEMEFWARKQNIALDKVISFTDGTKIQFEQALVANGLGATVAAPGLLGIASEDVSTGARALAEQAKALGYPISDYILSPKSPPGVFIVAEHDKKQQMYLKYFKMGEGPDYILLRNFHLCHLEIAKTIRRVLRGGRVLLNNSIKPTISVAAITKRPLNPGTIIEKGTGSFDMRGVAVRIDDSPMHIPMGLLVNAVVARHISAGQQISFGDVEIPESLALHAWQEIIQKN